MEAIAKFEKVSFEQFKEDFISTVLGHVWFHTYDQTVEDDKVNVKTLTQEIRDIYNSIELPKRATTGSAGYDFFVPFDLEIKPGDTIKIPTGIRAIINDGWVLQCYPRSGLGFKYRMQLDNTVGIIDSDYSHSDNEGHIFAKVTNDSHDGKTINIASGSGFMQGIFIQYGITIDDKANGIRNGGFGSTSK